jgi:hypothetical protein
VVVEKTIQDNFAGRPEGEFPPSGFPTVFADGVSGYQPSAQTVKFFLYRLDPNMFGRSGFRANPFGQVVMPTVGFVQTAAFFQHAVKQLVAQGFIKQQDYDQMLVDIEAVNRPPASAPSA